jgi:hypothetical protein
VFQKLRWNTYLVQTGVNAMSSEILPQPGPKSTYPNTVFQSDHESVLSG